RADPEGLELHLDDRHAIDEENDVVAVVAVIGVDAKLTDRLKVVFAPVPDVDQRVRKRSAVIAREIAFLSEDVGGGEYVGNGQLFEQALKLRIQEFDPVESLKLLAKISFEGSAIADVGAVNIFQVAQLADERFLDILLPNNGRPGI